MQQPLAPSPAPAVPGAAPAPAACENCGAALQGRFCHACGQAADNALASVRAFLRSVASDLTNLDGRGPRSLGLLLARPGELTRAFLAGHRVRYTQPLQMYLLSAAAFFFVNAYRPFVSFDPRTRVVVSRLNSVGVSGGMSDSAYGGLARRGVSLDAFRAQFESTVTGYLPMLLVGSVLAFGGVLALFFRRQRPGYVPHAVFALHWSAFYLLLMILDRLRPQTVGDPRWAAGALAVVALVYLTVAVRRVYGQGWLPTIGKALGLFLVYQMLLAAWMLSAIALAFPQLL